MQDTITFTIEDFNKFKEDVFVYLDGTAFINLIRPTIKELEAKKLNPE